MDTEGSVVRLGQNGWVRSLEWMKVRNDVGTQSLGERCKETGEGQTYGEMLRAFSHAGVFVGAAGATHPKTGWSGPK